MTPTVYTTCLSRSAKQYPLGLLVVQNGEAPEPADTSDINGYEFDGATQFLFVNFADALKTLEVKVKKRGRGRGVKKKTFLLLGAQRDRRIDFVARSAGMIRRQERCGEQDQRGGYSTTGSNSATP